MEQRYIKHIRMKPFVVQILWLKIAIYQPLLVAGHLYKKITSFLSPVFSYDQDTSSTKNAIVFAFTTNPNCNSPSVVIKPEETLYVY